MFCMINIAYGYCTDCPTGCTARTAKANKKGSLGKAEAFCAHGCCSFFGLNQNCVYSLFSTGS